MDKRTYIQSFDWRTLIGIKKKFPETRTVALLDNTTIAYEYANVTGYPWLGGIDLEKDFNGDYVEAAKSIGASILSPLHGTGHSVNTIGYVPFTTADMVESAHRIGLKVIPWTVRAQRLHSPKSTNGEVLQVDDESTINKLIDDGVDAIISNYPERVKFVGRDRYISVGKKKNMHKAQCLANAALSV
jgi:glycerophosphoryl diester phosphodiesterase